MRRIILVAVTVACCFGIFGFLLLHHGPSSGGTVADAAKPTVLPEPETPKVWDMSALESIDTLEAKIDYVKYLDQVLPSLQDSDARAHDAALDIIISLPGQALFAVEKTAARPDLKDTTRAALTQVIPLLQSRAARQTAEDRENASLRDAALSAYDQFGEHDASWDAAARDLINAYFRLGAPRSSARADQDRVSDSFEKLIYSAHCNDALLAYFYARMANEFQAEDYARQNCEQSIKDAVTKMDQSRYPAAWKALAHWEPRPLARGVYVWTPRGYFPPNQAGFYGQVPPEETESLLKAPWLSPRQKTEWLNAWIDSISTTALNTAAPNVVYDIKQDYDRVHPIVVASLPAGANPLLFEAKFEYVSAVMQLAKKKSPAEPDSVDYNNLVDNAARAAKTAYSMDKNDERAPTLMVEICFNEKDNRDDIDYWYKLAMQINPDNYHACLGRLLAYKRDSEMIAFARQFRASHNYRGQLPLMVVEGAQLLCAYTNSKMNSISRADFWQDIHDVYEQYLALFPEDRQERTRYLTLAVAGDHWQDAKKQFDVLDTNPWPGFFDASFPYDQLRQKANQLAIPSNN